ncbi:MAG: hypothetical protein CXR30_13555 [Geobacter sp.]|nr:MAG: hypothetical protein CXR30_13555 [Geobacter sp.]
MSLSNDLNKFLSRSWLERRMLLEAFFWLGLMRAAIILVPFRHIVSIFGLSTGQPTATCAGNPDNLATIVGWAIKAAAARTPWESVCLGQALAGMAMLRRRRIPGTIFLGVAKDATVPETMTAHAWLSSGDTTLTGDYVQNKYSVISSFFWLS